MASDDAELVVRGFGDRMDIVASLGRSEPAVGSMWRRISELLTMCYSGWKEAAHHGSAGMRILEGIIDELRKASNGYWTDIRQAVVCEGLSVYIRAST